MLVVSIPHVPGWRVVKTLGLVSGEAILGANVFRDFFASVRDVVGGRSGGYETCLRDAKSIAMDEMRAHAAKRGGNAVLGADLDYENIGGMLMVCASGTAVEIEPEANP